MNRYSGSIQRDRDAAGGSNVRGVAGKAIRDVDHSARLSAFSQPECFCNARKRMHIRAKRVVTRSATLAQHANGR
jgi:hypothetical protein